MNIKSKLRRNLSIERNRAQAYGYVKAYGTKKRLSNFMSEFRIKTKERMRRFRSLMQELRRGIY